MCLWSIFEVEERYVWCFEASMSNVRENEGGRKTMARKQQFMDCQEKIFVCREVTSELLQIGRHEQ